MFQKQALKILLSSLTIASSAQAYDVKLLEKGDIAPYRGLLFTEVSSKKLQRELQECDKTQRINESLKVSIEIYKKNEGLFLSDIEKLKAQNKNLEEAVVKAKDNSWLENAAYFGLGALASGLIVYATSR